MKVYKVVRKSRAKDPNRYLSAIVNKKALVIYKVGEWAVAPQWLRELNLHPVAFETLASAISFREFYGGSSYSIFEAETDDWFEPGWTCDSYERISNGKHNNHWDWPGNTIMCKRLMLLKKVA